MSEASIELIVREISTLQRRDGTTTFRVQVATVTADTIAFHEVAFGDEVELAAALEDARWRHIRIRVPATFFAQDDATKRALLKQALGVR